MDSSCSNSEIETDIQSRADTLIKAHYSARTGSSHYFYRDHSIDKRLARSTAITTIIQEPVVHEITEPNPISNPLVIPLYQKQVVVGETAAMVSGKAVYKRTKRLKCLPRLPKTNKSLAIYRRFWYLYFPIAVVIAILVGIFVAIAVLILDETPVATPTVPNNTYIPNIQPVYRTIDSPDGTKHKESVLDSMELSIRNQCAYLHNTTDISTFYKEKCTLDYCFRDPGILTAQVLSVCTLGRLYDNMPPSQNWMPSRFYCAWPGIVCDEEELVISLSLSGIVPSSIPYSLTNLYRLVNLSIVGNSKSIGGYIPSELFQIETLTHISLSLVGYQFGLANISNSILSIQFDSLPGWDMLIPQNLGSFGLENFSLKNIPIGPALFSFLGNATVWKDSLLSLHIENINSTFELDPFAFERLESLELTGIPGNKSKACLWGKHHECISCCENAK
ncbi:hypothetical protein HDV06_005038 [Boothiomyces sp. JEL0866]|nr:hypothetical protein HDV06_005038 [Boothiomyces sp. JEL0866]